MITKKEADKLLRLAFVQTRTWGAAVSAKRGDDTKQLDLTADIAEENFKAYVASITERQEEA